MLSRHNRFTWNKFRARACYVYITYYALIKESAYACIIMLCIVSIITFRKNYSISSMSTRVNTIMPVESRPCVRSIYVE